MDYTILRFNSYSSGITSFFQGPRKVASNQHILLDLQKEIIDI